MKGAPSTTYTKGIAYLTHDDTVNRTNGSYLLMYDRSHGQNDDRRYDHNYGYQAAYLTSCGWYIYCVAEDVESIIVITI